MAVSVPSPTLRGPLYQRVHAVLLQRISDGEYAEGSSLPAEARLADEFEVSIATIRKAVDELVARGYVVRRQGSGTYVRRQADASGEPFVGSIEDLISETPQLSILDVRVEKGSRFPHDVRAEFGPDCPGTGIAVRSRRTANDALFVYSVHYLSPRLGDVTRKELGSSGMMSLLRRRGFRLTTAEQTMAARLADVEVAEELGIALGSPVLLARRVLHDDQGALDVTRSWYRGDMYEYRTSLDLG